MMHIFKYLVIHLAFGIKAVSFFVLCHGYFGAPDIVQSELCASHLLRQTSDKTDFHDSFDFTVVEDTCSSCFRNNAVSTVFSKHTCHVR